MKNCLICQTGQDQVALTRIAIKMESDPWGDILVCKNCMEMLGVEEVKNLIGIAVKEKAYDASNVILVHEKIAEPESSEGTGMFEVPLSASLLRDSAAFARTVGEKMGSKLWAMHKGGVSEAVWTTSMTPDGEGGFIFSALFAKAPTEAR